MDFDAATKFVQQHFTDGLVLVIGSGLSAAEGIPGMPALAKHLEIQSHTLLGRDSDLWKQISAELATGSGLEAALLKHAPTPFLEEWIIKEACALLVPIEREVITEVFKGTRNLRLTTLLSRILKPQTGLPILTPNYDRLIEVACELAGFHVDTTAMGVYAGAFDYARSCMASCKGVTTRAKVTVLDHFPRAVVLKPHGSLDWYRSGDSGRRCSLDLDVDRLIITPGLNKYRAGYDSPFDKHRELANNFISSAARFLIVGYGFNDDHLQVHLLRRIRDGAPTLILTRTPGPMIERLAKESPMCVCLSEIPGDSGVTITTKAGSTAHKGSQIWDIEILAQELLA